MRVPSASPLRVLVVDDDPYTHMMLKAYCDRLGYVTLHANNGQEGVERAMSDDPDIILMDVLMPVMDGLEAARIIKSRQDLWRPIVFLTGMNEEKQLVSALESGGDDFLSKPANFTILTAKLASLKRTLKLNQKVSEQARRLLAYREAMQDELAIAQDLIQRFVYSPMRSDPAFDYWLMSAEELSGDVVAMTRTPSGALHMMLADGIGHGLHAAINVMPITPIFYRMSARGASLAEIIHALDETIREQLPVDRFVSAILVSADWHRATLQVWNGGIPKAYLLNDENTLTGYCEPSCRPLGIRRKQRIEDEIREIPWSENLRLFAYSDGLLEGADPSGEQFGHLRLSQTLIEAPKGLEAEHVRTQLQTHLAGQALADDVSFAMLRLDKPVSRFPARAPGQALVSGWAFSLCLSASDLQQLDPVYVLTHQLEALNIRPDRLAPLQMILSELCANALEHGLLGIDSELKYGDDLEAYFTERARRLQDLESGELRVLIQVIQSESSPALSIKIEDSGNGFDTSRLKDENGMNENLGRSERGIPLLKMLGRNLTYNEKGNCAEIEFDL